MRKLSTLVVALGLTCTFLFGAWVLPQCLKSEARNVCSFFPSQVLASEGGAAKSEGGEGKEAEGEGEHEEGSFGWYLAQWFVLIGAFGLSLAYVFKVRTKGKSEHEGKILAYALIVLVLVFFALGYHPGIVGYIESGSEPGFVGALKFLLLLVTGALVTFYGVLGRHDH